MRRLGAITSTAEAGQGRAGQGSMNELIRCHTGFDPRSAANLNAGFLPRAAIEVAAQGKR